MQRFFLPPSCFNKNTVTIRDPETLHQMQRVLRMKHGDIFITLDNTGFEYVCALANSNKSEMRATISETRKNAAEPIFKLTLYQSLPKKAELFEWVLQKCTEIGVSTFVPLITERTERIMLPKLERLERILKEAAEQSERGRIPELVEPIIFQKILEQRTDDILLHGRYDYPLLSSLCEKIKSWGACNLFVGPEGGFTEKEVQAAQERGFIIASLGKRVLRTETAGIVAAYNILA